MIHKIIFTVFIAGIIAIASCTKEKAPIKATNFECSDTISYVNHIQPMISLNCTVAGCHDATSSGGYNLTSYSAVSENAEIIRETIMHNPGVAAMPFAQPKLADSLIQQFACWVEQGTLNN